jgi:hypothetical protein
MRGLGLSNSEGFDTEGLHEPVPGLRAIVVAMDRVDKLPATVTEVLSIHAIRWISQNNIECIIGASFEPFKAITLNQL